MKRRKILYLFPLAALILSGCTFQEGWETVKGFASNKVYEPAKSFVEKLLGKEQKKEEKEDNQGGSQQGSGQGQGQGQGQGGGQGGGGQQSTTNYGSEASPLSVAEALAIIEEECAEENALTKQALVVEGEIYSAMKTYDYDSGPAFECYLGNDEEQIYIYRVHGAEADKPNFKEGSILKFRGFGKNFKGTLEFCDNGSDQCTVLSLQKPQGTEAVTGIEFDETSYDLQVGETKKVTASVLPLNAGNQNYTISLNNVSPEGCVTLEEGNVLSAHAVGTAKMVATSEEGGKTAEININVIAAVNYGSLENPLTIEEVMAIVDSEGTTKKPVYITGEVSKNEAYNSQYKNTEIWITDGTNDFEFYGCSLPEGFEPAQPQKNDAALVGKIVVAHGTAKKYKDTYELDKGCAIDTVSDPAPITIESVTVSPESADLEVGQQKILTATVAPAKASQEVKWSVQQTSEVVSVDEDGKVTALAEGEATVVATSDADSTKSGLCAITVTAATKTLDSIAITGELTKSTYTEGEDYSAEGLKVMAHYDKGEDVDVTTLATITPSKAKAALNDTSVTFSATYTENQVEKTAEKAFDVVVNELKGTEEKPYSVSEAYAVFEGLSDGETTEQVFVEGYINSTPAPTTSSSRGRFYLTDGVCATDLYAYNVNNTDGTNSVTLETIPVGGKALVQGVIKNYGGTFELCWVQGEVDCKLAKAVEAPVITAVGAVTGPAEVALNGTIDPNNVTVAVTYSGVVEATVKAATVTGDFSTAGETTVDVTIEGWNDTLHFTVTVVSGTVLTEQEVYKLEPESTGGNTAPHNSYTAAATVTIGGVEWSVTANSNMVPWRLGGGKNTGLDKVDREIISQGVVSTDDITKVIVATGAGSGITVNSITLKVGTSAGASDISSVAVTENLIQNDNIVFERPENANWAGRYFSIVFNVSVSGTSNKFVEFVGASFLAMK